MKLTAKELFGLNSVSEQVTITKIEFVNGEGHVSFKDASNKDKTIIFKNSADVEQMFFGRVQNVVAKQSKKTEYASEDEMNMMTNKQRRVRCPLTNELITSDEYHANKKEGKYAEIMAQPQ